MRLLPLLLLSLHGFACAATPCDTVGTQLAAMVKTDQEVRDASMRQQHDAAVPAAARGELKRKWTEIDTANTAQVKRILAECGWPVDKKASHDAWLLVQHADADPAFQRHAKGLLADAVKRKTASGTDLAYLSDRIATGEGRPQEYGTQFKVVDRCTLELFPVDDLKLANERRRAAGMPSVEQYLAEGRKVILPADCK